MIPIRRSRDLHGTHSQGRPRVAANPTYQERTLCPDCGAFYAHRVWRVPAAIAFDAVAAEATCPACRQVAGARGYGEVDIPGPIPPELQDSVRRRARNVARRAAFTQPERRIVRVRGDASGMTIVATSQKLAHRIAHELQKAFGGRATYAWSDHDGALRARWDPKAPHS